MNASVDEIARFCQDEQIDAYFHKGGILPAGGTFDRMSGELSWASTL
jgi:hypothetical protein